MTTAHEVYPEVVILSTRFDFTSDYIVAQLHDKGVPYLRINSEDMSLFNVILDPVSQTLTLENNDYLYVVSPKSVRSFLFRRPVFLRDYGDDHRKPEERFSRIQWATLIRNLILFEDARWINDPVATYRAEHKAYQLYAASKVGFSVPNTIITNNPSTNVLSSFSDPVVMKGLDTVLLRFDGQELFGYTHLVNSSELDCANWRTAPGIIQQALLNKLDLRVTVINDIVFCAAITWNNENIKGDWRARMREAEFSPYDLPTEVRIRCISLLKELGLRYGAIDLAVDSGEFYFLEINPTGEWAWLVNSTGMRIDSAITDALISMEDK